MHITVRGRTVRIHLVGILDRDGAARLIQAANRALMGGRAMVVLDASRLAHLDYRCVPMLVRWNRGLASFGHRLVLERWSPYLQAILAMEDWDGELERGSRGPGWRSADTQLAQVQAP
ncbi:MAG: STAS domain-containing protein [Candidatus Krumholzibacteriia bacterium]